MVKFQWFPKRDDSPRFFFSRKEKEKISKTISILEGRTSAELCVHVERKNKKETAFDQAKRAFERLGLTKTRERNAVLFFILSDSREFAVLGDVGIHEKVADDFWQKVSEAMAEQFRKNLFADGVCAGIALAGEKLCAHFPWRPDDENELSDDISCSR